MGKVLKFEDLKIWQESRVLTQEIFTHILSNKELKDYALKDQINRSSASTMDNIAEGFGRKGNKEFRQFLTFANGSNDEVQSQLYRSLDRHYINQETFEALMNNCSSISKMINGLIKYLNSSEMKGSKFRVDEPVEPYGSDLLEL